MRKLIDIIGDSKILSQSGNSNISINEIKIDSRKVGSDDMYVAIKGYSSDGHDYIKSAIENGATSILCEKFPTEILDGVTYLKVKSTRATIGEFAKIYYHDPTADIKLIGVTGTNGKTTIATLLFQLFTALGYKVGLISTVENKISNTVISTERTTPDVVSVNKLLRQMADSGCEYAFMEISSHAMDQERVAGVKFVGGVFTNLSHDHLDYHKTFDNYLAAKKKFFDNMDSEAFAISNIDDKRGEVMLQNTKAKKITYGLRRMATYKGRIVSNTIHGLSMKINNVEAHFRMSGEFNAYNLLAVYAVASELCFGHEEILTILTDLSGAEGRFEKVIVGEGHRVGIVDYAHTPDALKNVLETVNVVKSAGSKVITVVGCGGDRDESKRPKMARIASKLSSRVILTNDNPRTEDPEKILDQMEAGLEKEKRKSCLRIAERKQAIKTAVMLAEDGDIILIVGKGHEKYQEINGVKHPFDDKKVLRAAMLGDA